MDDGDDDLFGDNAVPLFTQVLRDPAPTSVMSQPLTSPPTSVANAETSNVDLVAPPPVEDDDFSMRRGRKRGHGRPTTTAASAAAVSICAAAAAAVVDGDDADDDDNGDDDDDDDDEVLGGRRKSRKLNGGPQIRGPARRPMEPDDDDDLGPSSISRRSGRGNNPHRSGPSVAASHPVRPPREPVAIRRQPPPTNTINLEKFNQVLETAGTLSLPVPKLVTVDERLRENLKNQFPSGANNSVSEDSGGSQRGSGEPKLDGDRDGDKGDGASGGAAGDDDPDAISISFQYEIHRFEYRVKPEDILEVYFEKVKEQVRAAVEKNFQKAHREAPTPAPPTAPAAKGKKAVPTPAAVVPGNPLGPQSAPKIISIEPRFDGKTLNVKKSFQALELEDEDSIDVIVKLAQ